MELLDRYVQAVNSFLPQAQHDDIGKELSANLQAQMDDRSAELGRPLSEAEQEALLQQHGHPMVVAGHYQMNQGRLVFGRQLIGTTLFPFYRRVLWLNVGVSVAIYLVVIIAFIASGNAFTVTGILSVLLLQLFVQFVVVTGIFSALEQYLPTRPWNPHRLSAVPVLPRQGQQRPRLEAIAEIVAITVSLLWLRVFFTQPSLLFGSAADTYQLGMVWQQVVLPTMLLYVVSIAQAVITLFRPTWVRFRLVVRLATESVALGIVVYLLRTGHWVVLVHPIDNGGTALDTINEYVFYGLLSTAVGVVIVVLIDVWKLLRVVPKQAALSQK